MSLFLGILAAILGALLTQGAGMVLVPLVGSYAALRLVVCLVPLAYMGLLLALAPRRAGRVVTGTGAVILAAVVYLGPFGLGTALCLQGLGIWVVRSLCYHGRLIAVLADGGLVGLGLAVAGGLVLGGQNATTAVWVALLLQAAFVYLRGNAQAGAPPEPDGFQRAFLAADRALRDLSQSPRSGAGAHIR